MTQIYISDVQKSVKMCDKAPLKDEDGFPLLN